MYNTSTTKQRRIWGFESTSMPYFSMKVLPYVLQINTDKRYKMKWFTLINEKIEGPYTTETLSRKIEAESLTAETMIWGPLQIGWKPLEWWRKSLPHFKSIKTDIDALEQWFYVKQGQRVGPVSRAELISQLKSMTENSETIGRVLIWTKGYKKWTPVTEQHDLMNELGLDQRKHPRARAQGRIVISFNGQTHITSLKSISEGGLGCDNIPMVYPGEEVNVSIESEDLGAPINAKAEIRYVNHSHTGFKFIGLNSENKAAIVTYVKNKISLTHKSAA